MSAELRQVTVAPERIGRWVEGCESRHGGLSRSFAREGVLRLSAADGFEAEIQPLLTDRSLREAIVDPALPLVRVPLVQWARPEAVVALLLIRRGGYAVGVARGPRLVRHKSGTRYVQSRTAAGGWSQQRFARRRVNQADALVGAVQDHVARVILGVEPSRVEPWLRAEALVSGGDRALVGAVLDDPRLRGLVDLPGTALYDLPDPRLEILERALARGRAVRIGVFDPQA